MISQKFLFLIGSILVSLSVAARGDVIFEHSGLTNPTLESWSVIGPGNGVTTGPVNNDLGLGIDAWFVDDSSIVNGSWTQYTQTPDATTNSLAAAGGWELSVELRMVEGTIGAADGLFADYGNGTRRYFMTFERESDGDPTVSIAGGSYTLEGAGDQDYHLYQLIFDPTQGNTDLFVDGIERISDDSGVVTTANRVNWGASGSNATGRGHFSSVQFSAAVPEPSAAIFLMVAGMLVAGRMRRRAR